MVNSQWTWIPVGSQTWDCDLKRHVRDLEKENKEAQGHVLLALTSAAYLSSSPQRLGFSLQPCRQHFYLEDVGRGRGGVNGEGHLQRSFDASPCFLLLEGLLIFKRARLEPWVCVCVVRLPFYGLLLYSGIPGILQLQKLPCAGSFRADNTAFLSA